MSEALNICMECGLEAHDCMCAPLGHEPEIMTSHKLSDGDIERIRMRVINIHPHSPIMPVNAHEVSAIVTELQSLRAAGEWLPIESARDGEEFSAKVLLARKHHIAGWKYLECVECTASSWVKRGYTYFKFITPPDPTNTDILAEMREENAQLIEQVSIRDNRDRDMQEIMPVNAHEVSAIVTELQSLRAAGEWRNIYLAPQDGVLLIAKEGARGWHYKAIDYRDVEINIRDDWTRVKPITPPDETNTDILAEMREENAQLIEQVSIRDNRDRDMQEIMRINNAMRERDARLVEALKEIEDTAHSNGEVVAKSGYAAALSDCRMIAQKALSESEGGA